MIDYRQADLSQQERALCDFAIKLTLSCNQVDESDIASLRAFALSEKQITIATQIISYFNYINRIADGLGVDNETWMDERPQTEWEQQRGRDYLTSLRDG
ncbi:MAG: hypothetical protein P8N76_22635 [Pirellulaceae bacterium]|nr:hypothetical protein [Pirellulaceae bacterium]